MLALALILASAASSATDHLERRWLDRVEISTGSTTAQRERLTAALKALLRSKTARPRCRALMKLPGRVQVGFYSHPDTVLDESGFGLALEGSVGATMRLEDAVRVVIDERLGEGPLGSIEETLAHELLGHAPLDLEAKRDDALEALAYYEDDELRAKLLGAVVGFELGRTTRDPDYENLHSTEAFRSFLYSGPATGLRLSLEELPAAAEKLRERRAGLGALRRAAEGLLRGYEIWRWRIAHLKQAHGREAAAFLDVEEALTQNESSKKFWLKSYADADGAIEGVLTGLVPQDGPDARALARADALGIPGRLRRDVLSLQAEFKRRWEKLPEPPPTPEAARAVTQLDWAAIEALVREDKTAHPEHYEGEPPSLD